MLNSIKMYDLFSREVFWQPGAYKGNAIRSFALTGVALYFSLFVILAGGLTPLFWLWMLIPILLPPSAMLHPLYGARRSERWRSDYDLRFEGQYYRCLPKDDKSFYPYNIIKTITDPDLSDEQAIALDKKMSDLRREINDRNLQRRLAVKKHLDISDLLQTMEDSKANVAIETNTYKELM